MQCVTKCHQIWTRPNRILLDETESEAPCFAFQLESRLLVLPFAFYSAGTCQSLPTGSAGARNLCQSLPTPSSGIQRAQNLCESPPTGSAGILRARNLCQRPPTGFARAWNLCSPRAESDGIEILLLDFLHHAQDSPLCWEENCKPSSTFDKSNSVGSKKGP